MIRMKLRFLIIIFIFLSSFEEVSGLLAGPSSFNIDFEPNLRREYSYTIFNNENKVLYVSMNITGDLSEYYRLSAQNAVLEPQESKSFVFLLELPFDIEKGGVHTSHLIITEVAPEGVGGTISGRVAIDLPISLRVPYHGKYLEATLSVNNVKLGDVADFVITLYNYGEDDLFGVVTTASVYYGEEEVATLTSGGIDIKSRENKQVVLSWDTTGRRLGSYRVEATVDYDGKSAKVRSDFKIGDILIEILNITGEEVVVGRINRIDVTAQSMWNERIGGIYAQLEVDTGIEVMQTKSKNIDFEPFEIKTFDIYFDTKDFEVGKYNAKVTVVYMNKTAERSFVINVKKGALGGLFSFQTALIIIIIILVGINLWGYLKRKRKINRSNTLKRVMR